VRQLRDLSVIDEGISTHTLRRTYTAMMLAHGNPPKSVQEEAGHADERTTLRIYAQAIKAHQADPHGAVRLHRRLAPPRPALPAVSQWPPAEARRGGHDHIPRRLRRARVRRAARQLHLNLDGRAPAPQAG
jgi:hypothetical protein